MLARRIGLGVAAWVVAATSLVVFVTRPEECPSITVSDAQKGIDSAVTWLQANQRANGGWLYRYNRATRKDLGGYNYARHSGAVLALYQAGDIATADRGVSFALDRLHREDGWAAFGTGDSFDVGASALLVAALGQRRLDTGDPKYDEVMADLGRFLVAMTLPDGKVQADWRPSTQTASGTLAFYTGEAWFALSRLERLFPDAEWREPAERIGRYVMLRRDDAENIYPPTSDHWGSYAMDETLHWKPLPSSELTQMMDDYVKRLVGVFGVQTRFESQRTGSGLSLLLRGHQTLPAGLGTIGEGMGALARYEATRGRPDEQAALLNRISCVDGRLLARQGHGFGDPSADGAWFHSDVTQVDDQQHPIESLVAYVHLASAGSGGG